MHGYWLAIYWCHLYSYLENFNSVDFIDVYATTKTLHGYWYIAMISVVYMGTCKSFSVYDSLTTRLFWLES